MRTALTGDQTEKINLMRYSYRTRFVIVFTTLSVCLLGLVSCQHAPTRDLEALHAQDPVGLIGPNLYRTATGQYLTPAGQQVALPGMRPVGLALSPRGDLLATAGQNRVLVLIDPATGAILQERQLSIKKSETSSETVTAQMSFNGLIFSPDGRKIYLSNTGGNVWAIPVDDARHAGEPSLIAVPNANLPGQKRDLPTGLAVSADGRRLYVAGSLANRLHEIATDTGQTLRSWDTGAAPFDLAIVKNKIYVSNLGGRRPGTNDVTAPAGKGTTVRVDPVRYIASEGSVTVIDLASGQVKDEILVGLHASALAVSPDQKYVVVANSGSDTLNVIDTATDRVVEKIWARQNPGDLFGAQPNALAFDPSGKRLYVCNGTQNAVVVIDFEPKKNASKAIGLIPVAWFPGAIQYDAGHNLLCVANMKGIGSAKDFAPDEKTKLRTRDFYGTLSLVPVPSRKALVAHTQRALGNMRYPRIAEAFLPARPNQPPRPVPERIGEPSVFKHVIYIIKENRSYDQVLGDMPEGNGDPELCVFGEQFTPNQHKIAREFVLLDNTYCAGVKSADGHQWTDSAIANDYMERQISADTPRSYPGGKSGSGADALAWASSGFIWDNVLEHGKTFRNYGEWMLSEAGWSDPKQKGRPNWRDYRRELQDRAGRVRLRSRPAVESLRPHSATNTVGWDLSVPDVMRAEYFIRELREFEVRGGFPHFMIIFLPNDHTAGASASHATPGALMADNDLGFGLIVEAVSHSKFWPETCIFAIEDDPQNGWDHVSGYRTTCYVVSPYTKRRQTISTQYNQPGVIRTMELILGLPPMNQLDATATPMFDCFMNEPDFTPYTAVPNQVSLDEMNSDPKKIADPILRRDALVSARFSLDQEDKCPEDVLNRILWRAMKGTQTPFPEWAVKALDDDDD